MFPLFIFPGVKTLQLCSSPKYVVSHNTWQASHKSFCHTGSSSGSKNVHVSAKDWTTNISRHHRRTPPVYICTSKTLSSKFEIQHFLPHLVLAPESFCLFTETRSHSDDFLNELWHFRFTRVETVQCSKMTNQSRPDLANEPKKWELWDHFTYIIMRQCHES